MLQVETPLQCLEKGDNSMRLRCLAKLSVCQSMYSSPVLIDAVKAEALPAPVKKEKRHNTGTPGADPGPARYARCRGK